MKRPVVIVIIAAAVLIAAAWFVSIRLKNLPMVTSLGSTPPVSSGTSTPTVGKPSGLPVLANAMPEFSGIKAWLNSQPLTAASLKGKVVLVDFWTYSCINCIRTLPYTTAWYGKYKDQGFVIVGVHTPEFAFEKVQSNVAAAVKSDGIEYPVAMDNDYGTWNAYGNQYWPAEYLFDAQGRLRHYHFGEGEYDQTEQAIQSLIAENGGKASDSIVTVPVPALEKIGSQETYLGYDRMEFGGNSETVKHDAPQTYSAPANPALNKFYYTGGWNVGPESASPTAAGAGITYRYHANKINLVMGSTDGQPVKAKITIDGKATQEMTIQEDQLYTLYDDSGAYGEHVMHIEFEGTNAAAYAFTFG